MRTHWKTICALAGLAATLGGLAGCTLTTREVEPDLPTSPVNASNTVAYHLNGQAVVAHNYSNLGTLIIAPFLGPFGGGPPVQAALRSDGTLLLACIDAQNIVRPGYIQHYLTWQLVGFRGVATYQPAPANTILQLQTRDAADEQWLQGAQQPMTSQAPAEIAVTDWNPTTRHLRGTFQLQFDAAGNSPAAEVRDGFFDVTLTP